MNTTSLICLVMSFLGLAARGSAQTVSDAKLFDVQSLALLPGTSELSGFHKTPKGQLLAVSDEPDEPFVYRLTIVGQRVQATKVADLASSGFGTLDLEGITGCGKSLYLADERQRGVISLPLGKSPRQLVLHDMPATVLEESDDNAVFEGIAADCVGGRLYLAKERDPRRILVFTLPGGAFVEEWDFALPPGYPRNSTWTGESKVISPDVADLVFADGHLYALERGYWQITKIDPKSHAVRARLGYYEIEKGLYDNPAPYGIAEALALYSDRIYLGFDHNGVPLGDKGRSAVAADKSEGGGIIAILQRPKGF